MYRRYYKRILDLAFALCLLALTFWLFVIIILVYVVQFDYPIFFYQDRIGIGGTTFSIIKFRTLKLQGDTVDDRRFRFGNFLRRTSLDELPQIVNVIKGEMSFVGPRPMPLDYLPLYTNVQTQRHYVQPGITGWAQVNGRNSIPWDTKFQLDIYYVKNISFWLDLKILIKTIILILSFKKDASLQEQPFTGNTNA